MTWRNYDLVDVIDADDGEAPTTTANQRNKTSTYTMESKQ